MQVRFCGFFFWWLIALLLVFLFLQGTIFQTGSMRRTTSKSGGKTWKPLPGEQLISRRREAGRGKCEIFFLVFSHILV